MPPDSSQEKLQTNEYDPLRCLKAHLHAQMIAGSFFTIIHTGNNDYLRLLHSLICQLLLDKRRVYVMDYTRRIKSVYLQQLLQQNTTHSTQTLKNLHLRVILDEDHALNELIRLQRRTPSKRKIPALFVIDPAGLFGRMRGGVKQSAKALQFQYEAAVLFAEQGYSVVVSDSGSRQFHRVDSLVPTQLAVPATLILQYLPRRIILA
jgi:hypothetical protein